MQSHHDGPIHEEHSDSREVTLAGFKLPPPVSYCRILVWWLPMGVSTDAEGRCRNDWQNEVELEPKREARTRIRREQGISKSRGEIDRTISTTANRRSLAIDRLGNKEAKCIRQLPTLGHTYKYWVTSRYRCDIHFRWKFMFSLLHGDLRLWVVEKPVRMYVIVLEYI